MFKASWPAGFAHIGPPGDRRLLRRGVMYTPKTRKGSAKSAAFSKLRTRAHENCEHALVELGGIETQKSVHDVRLDR